VELHRCEGWRLESGDGEATTFDGNFRFDQFDALVDREDRIPAAPIAEDRPQRATISLLAFPELALN
jgi:hypothetical protein